MARIKRESEMQQRREAKFFLLAARRDLFLLLPRPRPALFLVERVSECNVPDCRPGQSLKYKSVLAAIHTAHAVNPIRRT